MKDYSTVTHQTGINHKKIQEVKYNNSINGQQRRTNNHGATSKKKIPLTKRINTLDANIQKSHQNNITKNYINNSEQHKREQTDQRKSNTGTYTNIQIKY